MYYFHDAKTCFARRHRCETIWVCQEILALHQLAGVAAQHPKSLFVTSELHYQSGNFMWEFPANLHCVPHSSAHFQYGLCRGWTMSLMCSSYV